MKFRVRDELSMSASVWKYFLTLMSPLLQAADKQINKQTNTNKMGKLTHAVNCRK